MQVYALLGMNGRETLEAFFERAFSNPRSSGGGDDDDDDEATKKKSEKRRLLDIKTFQRHLFCIGGARDSAKAWLEKSEDVGAENAMLQVHACKINDLEALKRMIRLENKIIRICPMCFCESCRLASCIINKLRITDIPKNTKFYFKANKL